MCITHCSVKKKKGMFVLFVITSVDTLEESVLSLVCGGSSACHSDILVCRRLTKGVCSLSSKLFY